MDLEEANKIYRECAEIIASKISKHLDKSLNITIEDLRKKISIPKNKINKKNWYDANCIEELLRFKNEELRAILRENNKKLGGNKKILAQRVWNITHPTMNIKPKKFNISITDNNISNYIDDSDTDSESDSDDNTETNDLLDIIKDSEKINLDNIILNESIKDNINNANLILVKDKKWVFRELDTYYEFIGILENNCINKCCIPDKIKSYYLQ